MSAWGEVIGGPRTWARELGLAAFVGLALAFIGPFGSYARPLEVRLLASVSYGVAGSVVFWPTLRAALMLGRRARLPEPFAAVLGLAAASLPVTGVVLLLRPLVAPGGSGVASASLYFAVLALALPLGLAVLFVGRWAEPRREAVAAPEFVAEAPVEGPRVLARVPLKARGELLALQAEDHYVRIHTSAGDALVLMRLADAVAEADGIEGLRVHRSWWVARAAVRDARAEGRRATLTLSNGVSAPVTREVVPEIRRLGWL